LVRSVGSVRLVGQVNHIVWIGQDGRASWINGSVVQVVWIGQVRQNSLVRRIGWSNKLVRSDRWVGSVRSVKSDRLMESTARTGV
jgi:hypothetical protein